MGTISMFGSTVLIVAFVISLIGFAGLFGIYQNSNVLLDNDTTFSSIKSELTENVTLFGRDARTAFNETIKSTISSQTEATEGGTAYKVGPATALSMSNTAVKGGFEKIFGSANEFTVYFNLLIAFLIFVFGFYIIKTWKGSPD